eukprot:14392530-Alexandrium_andersonii.AAC.1
MSASLVGSEMCIRDSPLHCRQGHLSPLPPRHVTCPQVRHVLRCCNPMRDHHARVHAARAHGSMSGLALRQSR